MRVAKMMTRDPVTVSVGASLDHAMDLMDEYDIRHLPVLSDAGLVGVISDRDLLEATGWLHRKSQRVVKPLNTVRDVMRTPVVTVGQDDPITDALGLLIMRRIGCVPVLHDGVVTGLVTEMDILRAYGAACRRGELGPGDDPQIEEHMTRDPTVIEGDASGDEAAAVMKEVQVRHLPVVQDGEVSGIVSDRDLRRLRGRGQLESTLMRELMISVPQSVAPETHLSSVALILSSERIGALPILSDRSLVGITTTVDVMIPCAQLLHGR